jgi:hypothetical protein
MCEQKHPEPSIQNAAQTEQKQAINPKITPFGLKNTQPQI